MAEQQRAKSEIEAALTIAAARPRDEKECLDRILTSCQRPGVAEAAEYEYSRGGTSIVGATIKLLELVAQKWGNIEFGFRELARYPGVGGQPGESVVEAFAWDLESNTRRRAQFTVRHELGLKGGRTKTLTDPRDVYEWIANQAMRRVRTCLENVIPRDIVDAARDEARKTLATNEAITPQKIANVVKAFSEYGVTKAQIEARLQRHLDTITPAQMVQLRRIYTSLKDGMGEPSDWFTVEADQPEKSTKEKAKDALRKQAKPAAAAAEQPKAAEKAPEPQPKEEAAAEPVHQEAEREPGDDGEYRPAETQEEPSRASYWEKRIELADNRTQLSRTIPDLIGLDEELTANEKVTLKEKAVARGEAMKGRRT